MTTKDTRQIIKVLHSNADEIALWLEPRCDEVPKAVERGISLEIERLRTLAEKLEGVCLCRKRLG